MQEVIHKIDNWTIIKLLGGLAVIIAGIMTLSGKIFLERLKHLWATKAGEKLESIKGEIQKGNTKLNNLTLSYLNNFQKIQDKRIEAAETLWTAVLEIRNGIPNPVSLSLNILLDAEFKKPFLDSSRNGLTIH